MLTLRPNWFIGYKFFNSLFLGLSVGAIFTLYIPLKPFVFSIGGVALAFGMLVVARFYRYIMNALWLFRISLGVEALLLLVMLVFLYEPYTYASALLVYVGYQFTFVFGNYLVRAETLLLKEETLLTMLDTAKQFGYLLGMGAVYLFYRFLNAYGIEKNQEQIYYLHYVLVGIEVVVILLILMSFSKEK